MRRTLTLTVTDGQAGRMIRSLLRRELSVPDGMLARLKTVPDGILKNGAPARTVDRVQPGDVLAVRIDDLRPHAAFAPIPAPLDIVYEDADLLVVNKAAGMAVHGACARGEATLANALAAYLGAETAFHPVNRLDRGTTGLMLAAKNGYTHDRLRRALHTDAFLREYRAVAAGVVAPADGVIDLPIGRETPGSRRRAVTPDGAAAVTEYRTLAVREGRTLLAVTPRTGRTHQIRVHFAAVGCPLVGDWLYGAAADFPRPALHSAAVAFTHPITGERLRFRAPPPDFAVLGFGEDL